jgi:hypothetical protein
MIHTKEKVRQRFSRLCLIECNGLFFGFEDRSLTNTIFFLEIKHTHFPAKETYLCSEKENIK